MPGLGGPVFLSTLPGLHHTPLVVVVVVFVFHPSVSHTPPFLHSYPCHLGLPWPPLPYHDSPVAKSLAFAGGCDC
ncbi:hypothetical protein BDP55DRAFT_673731 [Colletotrichum godetiae]|uniref:Uncharacterized protein n=1 Tax=Colletotrichum godetiae TaxID=1209918 RepID=A0AAJ0EUE4_9PEZI|nr:uncharacterized protein BDP55DRAFT_673731 [Colletotrichum godetiae]KAK1672144.1 hypothetical protein BDP55DRAFT_673731 [Colletotrichum godetiae]